MMVPVQIYLAENGQGQLDRFGELRIDIFWENGASLGLKVRKPKLLYLDTLKNLK